MTKYTKETLRNTKETLRRCPTGVELHYLQCFSIEYNYIYLYIFTLNKGDAKQKTV